MKIKHQISLYAGGAGMTTLAAILLSVREQLIMVGPWVLDTMLICAGSAVLYGGFRVFVSGRSHWLTLREKEQALDQDKERHSMEMLDLQASIHIKLSRLYADPNGNYPVLIPGTFVMPEQDNVLMFPNGQLRGAMPGQLQLNAAGQSDMALPQSTPVTSSFREVMPYILPEIAGRGGKKREAQVVLAMDHEGVVLGEILDWLSTLVVGMPGMGKSTALYFFIAQLMLLGARFQVLDPHASLISLKDLLPYINRTDGCIASAPLIEAELERRMDRYEANNGACPDQHYMLIVDELPAIADREQQLLKGMEKEEKSEFRSLIDVLRRVVCEGRKYKMYCMVVGQSIPASILPTIARDNMSSRYVFNCSPSHARMAGLDGKTIEEYLPLLEKSKGRCIVAPARMKPFVGAIPMTDVDDLRYVIEQTGYQREGWDEQGQQSVSDGQRLWIVPDTEEEGVPAGQDDLLERGIGAYQSGARTIDRFQAAMGLATQHQARKLWARVKLKLEEGA